MCVKMLGTVPSTQELTRPDALTCFFVAAHHLQQDRVEPRKPLGLNFDWGWARG